MNYVVNNERWQIDSFFRDYLVHYMNAATIINPEFRDTEQMDGVFSGLMTYDSKTKEWPFNGFMGEYDNKSWQYAGSPSESAAGRRTRSSRASRPSAITISTARGRRRSAETAAETILAASGRDRTTSFAYAVAWTQHTNGPQTIG